MLPSATDAYTALQSFKPQDPNAVISSANSQAGVDANLSRVSDLRSAVNNLNSSLNAVDPSVTGRTSGTFTTDAQRSALVNKEQAPIQTSLTARNNDLNVASSNLSDSQSKANSLAGAILSADKDTYQRLLDSYNAASAADQFKQNQGLEQQKLSEQAREANLTANAKTNSGIDLSPFLALLGNNNGSSAASSMSQRADKGFSFSSPNGQAISAAQFAAIKNIPFRTLLQQMANAGDAGAKTALGFVGNDYKYDPSKIANSSMANIYNSLVWGTGAPKATYTAPKTSSSSFRYAAPTMSLGF